MSSKKKITTSLRPEAKFMILWFLSFAMLVLLDMMWLSFALEKIYKPTYVRIQKKISFRIWSGIIVWLLLAAMIASRVFQGKNQTQEDWTMAGMGGIFNGLIIYGTYNFTNYSMFIHYDLLLSIVDTTWGMLAMGVTSFFMAMVAGRL